MTPPRAGWPLSSVPPSSMARGSLPPTRLEASSSFHQPSVGPHIPDKSPLQEGPLLQQRPVAARLDSFPGGSAQCLRMDIVEARLDMQGVPAPTQAVKPESERAAIDRSYSYTSGQPKWAPSPASPSNLSSFSGQQGNMPALSCPSAQKKLFMQPEYHRSLAYTSAQVSLAVQPGAHPISAYPCAQGISVQPVFNANFPTQAHPSAGNPSQKQQDLSRQDSLQRGEAGAVYSAHQGCSFKGGGNAAVSTHSNHVRKPLNEENSHLKGWSRGAGPTQYPFPQQMVLEAKDSLLSSKDTFPVQVRLSFHQIKT